MTEPLELIDALEETWQATIDVCNGLSEEEWRLATGCPGWTVQDQVSHLVGLEKAIAGRGEPTVSLPPDLPHLRNDSARYMETHVEARRRLPGSQVLDEFKGFAAERVQELRRQLAAESEDQRPTVESLRIRLFDSWIHEQDIRRALGRGSTFDSRAARAVLPTLFDAVGFALAKKVSLEPGKRVTINVDGDVRCYERNGTRVEACDDPGSPDVSIEMDTGTFVAVMGGRTDGQNYAFAGDAALGRRVVDNLGITP